MVTDADVERFLAAHYYPREQENMVRQEFAVHMLNDDGKAKAVRLAEAFSSLLDELERVVPGPSREMSLVKTKLEEASYYAKRAMASQPENRQ